MYHGKIYGNISLHNGKIAQKWWKNDRGASPPDPPILTGGQAPQTPRGFPRVLGTMLDRGLIHAISSLYEIKILGQNIRSKHDVKI